MGHAKKDTLLLPVSLVMLGVGTVAVGTWLRRGARRAVPPTTTTTSGAMQAEVGRRYLSSKGFPTTRDQPEEVQALHAKAVADGKETYLDPYTGFTVFTELAHKNRGKCCGSRCRHCPYDHENVVVDLPPPSKEWREKRRAEREQRRKDVEGGTSTMAKFDNMVKKLWTSPEHREEKYPQEKKVREAEEMPEPTPAYTASKAATATADEAASPAQPAKAAADKVQNVAAVPKKSGVYTRTGDAGTSALFTGERRSKDDVTFHCLGTTDELNSCIGVAREYCLLADNGLAAELLDIQRKLLDMGSVIATPHETATDAMRQQTRYDTEAWAKGLEARIDAMDAALPPLTCFIVPGGGLASAHLHQCRTVTRRAERLVVELCRHRGSEPDLDHARRYLNRLSDYFFLAARFAAHKDGSEEVRR